MLPRLRTYNVELGRFSVEFQQRMIHGLGKCRGSDGGTRIRHRGGDKVFLRLRDGFCPVLVSKLFRFFLITRSMVGFVVESIGRSHDSVDSRWTMAMDSRPGLKLQLGSLVWPVVRKGCLLTMIVGYSKNTLNINL